MHDRWTIPMVALAAALSAIACGGKQSMASKSAAAYAEAQKKGVPVNVHELGGHAVHAETATPHEHTGMEAMDHHAMPAHDHAAMTGTQHPAMQHHEMTGGMQHAEMQHHEMTGGMQHDEMTGMQHAAMPGMHHQETSAQFSIVTEGPRSASAMASVRPEATLRADEFDAPPKRDQR